MAGQSLHHRGDQCPRGGSDGDDNAIGAQGLGGAPAEHRLGRAPGGKSVDLRPNDAVEELLGAGRQLEGTKEETRRLQDQFDFAARQQLLRPWQNRTDDLAVLDAQRFADRPPGLSRPSYQEAAVFLFDQAELAAPAKQSADPRERDRGVVNAARDPRDR